MGGINSLRNYNFDKTFVQFESLITKIKESNPTAEIFVFSILPISKEKEITVVVSNKVIKEFNTKIMALSESIGLTYINLFDLFDLNGCINPEYTNDGVHLTREGFEIWENAITNYMDHHEDN